VVITEEVVNVVRSGKEDDYGSWVDERGKCTALGPDLAGESSARKAKRRRHSLRVSSKPR
jgi:hypothetical protein